MIHRYITNKIHKCTFQYII